MASTEQSGESVRRIVEEVLRRIAAESVTRMPANASPAAPAVVDGAVPRRSVEATPTSVVGPAAVLSERIVTRDLIARLPSGTRRVTVPPRAVITPSARDLSRELGLEIVSAAAAAHSSASARPFAVGQAACTGDGNRRCAAIVRAIPSAHQLPSSGLADVVAALAAHATRDGGRGVLLTGRPAVALVLANRHAGVRAVTGRDAAALARAAAECCANLLVIDPRDFVGGLERACGEFAARDHGAAPAELAVMPAADAASCSCKSHAH